LQGRLIPVPLEISGACGLAWLSETENKDEMEKLINVYGIQIDNIIEMEL
jgi:hypothetical protein